MPLFDENAPWLKSRSGILGDYLEWPHLDLNQGPTGYEPAALTN